MQINECQKILRKISKHTLLETTNDIKERIKQGKKTNIREAIGLALINEYFD